MAPARKKSRLSGGDNSPEASPQQDAPSATTTTAQQQQQQQQSGHGGTTLRPTTVDTNNSLAPPLIPSPTARSPAQNRGSWYSAASWKSKASPTAQVAKESISVDKGVSSESSTQEDSTRRVSGSVSKSIKGGSRKSIPLAAEATRVHAVGDALSVPKQRTNLASDEKVRSTPVQEKPCKPLPLERKESPAAEDEQVQQQPDQDQAPLPSQPAASDNDTNTETASMRPASGSWFGFWSRPDGYPGDGDKANSASKLVTDGAAEQASNTPLPNSSEDVVTKEGQPVLENTRDEEDPSGKLQSEMSIKHGSTRSWFGLWSKAQNEQAVEEERHRRASEQQEAQGKKAEDINDQAQPHPEVVVAAAADQTAKGVREAKALEQPLAEVDGSRPKSSGWAFWSKDKSKDESRPTGAEDTQKEVGELAVADTPSQSHPEAAQFNQQHEPKAEVKRNSSLLSRGRKSKPKDLSGETTAIGTPTESQAPTPVITQLHTPVESPEESPAPVQRGKRTQTRPNLVLPSFRDTYPTTSSKGYFDRLTQYIGHTLNISEPAKPALHPLVSAHPHKVKKAIAIGVHGYFPAALLQRVLGQPTGTSIRFANYAAASIKSWCQKHQPDVKNVEVEKVALEGEGIVSDRVSTLWKLLLNWLSQLRQADFILFACHSQGVPVTTMLVTKLIQLGCLSPNARIGICAMAGINLGPFLEYKSRFFGGSALELFDFSDRKSQVSMAYAEALDICLRHGVRVTFVGSLDDQLVSLESSLFTPVSHPYINRIVFIDGQLHTSNFLTHLVVFAAKLRNLGVSDHGLLREISAPLAGSIVGGVGHSRVYDDPAVYRNAIEFALESTDVSPSLFQASLPTADDKRKSMEEAASRRGSQASYPSNMNAANHMRRGSLGSLSLAQPGIAPVVAPFEPQGAIGAAEKNPFVLPWAVRGMLEEDVVKRGGKLQAEVKELVREFEDWKPTSKVLKDVRWRLEGVRSML